MSPPKSSGRGQYTDSYRKVEATRWVTARKHGKTQAIPPSKLNEIRGHPSTRSRGCEEHTTTTARPGSSSQRPKTRSSIETQGDASALPTSSIDHSLRAGAVKWGFYSDVYLLEACTQQRALDLGPPSNAENPASWDRPSRAMNLALFCHAMEGFSNNGVQNTEVTVPRQNAAFARAESLHDEEGSEINDRDEWAQTVGGISWREAGVMDSQWPLVRQVIEASTDKGDSGMLQYIRKLDPRRDVSDINGLAEEHLGSLVRAHSYFNPCPM